MPAARPERLMVFTRFPEPGKTKTRLIPALGTRGASCLQRQMTEHIMATAAALSSRNGTAVEVWYEGGNNRLMQDWLGSHLTYRRQGSGHLGQRMQRAFGAAFEGGAAAAVVVGSDIPGISVEILQQAFEALQKNELVLGPANDGGYYLIGIKGILPAETYGQLFEGIHWGSHSVLAQTLQVAAGMGLRLTQLERLSDVDRPADLPTWDQAKNIASHQDPGQKISIIIPALNEETTIDRTLSRFKDLNHLEVIVVDGGSTDKTVKLARSRNVRVIQSKPGKACQMNTGASVASGDILLFLHADTLLPQNFNQSIRHALNQKGVAAGAFRLSIDSTTAGIRFIERMADLRSRYLQLPYGDQALFMRKTLFEQIGGFPDMPIMEDFVLVQRLRRKGKIGMLPDAVITSPRRWQHLGVLKTWLVNQMIIIAFYLGFSPERLAHWYRRETGKTGK